MLRFRTGVKTVKSGRHRWRLWMLVIALGLVLATMRQLGRPSTARRLEQLFTTPPSSVVSSPAVSSTNFVAPAPRDNLDQEPSGMTQPAKNVVGRAEQIDLSSVKDKTYFRPAEREAWFALFAKLQHLDGSQLASSSCGEVSYAQFLQQPEVYRGRLVTLVGSVVREEPQQPAENEQDIDSYHRLWIRPLGGGRWPLVVYCLKLPEEFPRGENLAEAVSVTGFFFKNWSYAYDEGLGLAPVVLASRLNWQPRAAIPQVEPVTFRQGALAVAIACVFAAIATWYAMRQTRRRGYGSLAAPQLQELANQESEA